MHKMFVYGTLKRGEPNHYWITNPENGIGRFICKGKTKEKFPLIIATKWNIPFLLYCPGTGHNIEGEIYEMDDKMVCKLDLLENHPGYYSREMFDIIPEDSCQPEILKCWVYFIKDFKPHLLKFPLLRCYSNNGPHGLKYEDRSSRDPNYEYIDDVTDRKLE